MKTIFLSFICVFFIFNIQAQNSAVSSHFKFDGDGEADIISMEVRIPADGVTESTYYEVLGWSGNAGGYAGIQQSVHGRNYIFSIWDNDNQRGPIKEVYVGHGTTTETFGGEGTGLKSWNFAIPWEVDAWYSMNARCWNVKDHTYYGYWIREGVSGVWKHLVTMDVDLDDLSFPSRNDAFLEDWTSTGQNKREMHMRNSWRRTKTKQWVASQSGIHTVNSWDFDDPSDRSYNYSTNWDAGTGSDATGGYYIMISGGINTVNSVASGTTFYVPISDNRPTYAQGEISDLEVSYAGYDLNLSWDLDTTTLPQFRYAVKVYDNAEYSGTPVYNYTAGAPHHREFQATIKNAPGKYYGQFTLIDLFDNEEVTNFEFDITDKTIDIGLQKIENTSDYGCSSQEISLNLEVANFGSDVLTSFTAKVYINDVLYGSKDYTTSLERYEVSEFLFSGIQVPLKETNEIRVSVELPNNQTDPFQSDNEQTLALMFEGQLLSINGITTQSVSSQSGSEGPENLFDDDAATIWHNNWGVDAPLPHEFVFDLGKSYVLTGLDMLNRQNNTNGQPKDAEIYLSADGINWGAALPILFESTVQWQSVLFNGMAGARYVKLKITTTINGDNVCSMAEIKFKGCDTTSALKISDDKKPVVFVYPNPLNDIMNVQFSAIYSIQNVELRDMAGRLKLSSDQIESNGDNTFSMDVSSIPTGIYFLVITTPSGRTTSKVIKM